MHAPWCLTLGQFSCQYAGERLAFFSTGGTPTFCSITPKIRDAVVLPMAINGFLKIVTYALTKCSK